MLPGRKLHFSGPYSNPEIPNRAMTSPRDATKKTEWTLHAILFDILGIFCEMKRRRASTLQKPHGLTRRAFSLFVDKRCHARRLHQQTALRYFGPFPQCGLIRYTRFTGIPLRTYYMYSHLRRGPRNHFRVVSEA